MFSCFDYTSHLKLNSTTKNVDYRSKEIKKGKSCINQASRRKNHLSKANRLD